MFGTKNQCEFSNFIRNYDILLDMCVAYDGRENLEELTELLDSTVFDVTYYPTSGLYWATKHSDSTEVIFEFGLQQRLEFAHMCDVFSIKIECESQMENDEETTIETEYSIKALKGLVV